MEEILSYIITGCSVALVVTTTIISIIQRIKNGKLHKNENLYDRMLEDIETAEEMYAPIKAKGIDVSVMKKQYVLNDLQIFANSCGIALNLPVWEEELERMIDFSNQVNAITREKKITSKELI